MTEMMLKIINDAFPLKEKEMGRYKNASAGPMKLTSGCYEAEGLGNVSVMSGKALAGLMKMDTVIINPFDVDLPLVSYDRIFAMGSDTLMFEVYETRLDKSGLLPDYSDIASELAGIPDKEIESRWYDTLLLPGTFIKAGKKKETAVFDSFTEEYIRRFIAFAKDAAPCDRQAKIKSASVYTEGLISNGGASYDNLKKEVGKDFTDTLFREFMFGTGIPDEKEK